MGEGEKLVRALFAVARELQPSIIFIGESCQSGSFVFQDLCVSVNASLIVILMQMRLTVCCVRGGRASMTPAEDSKQSSSSNLME